MEAIDMINIWKTYDKRLEENLSFNRRNAEDITRIKVKSFLSSMQPLKIFTIVCGILWVGLLDVLVVNLFHIASPFFLISFGLLSLLNKLAIGIYLYQLILIYQVDISEPVLATQEKLARLKSTTLLVARILFLQLPLWTTFYLSARMFENAPVFVYLLTIGITGLFTFAAVWLFLNIKYENRHKKWFRLIFTGKEWTPVMRSMELLNELQEYDNKTTAS
jgi:hypothetical protein